MPNNGRITLCPYYRDEKNLSISCEDTSRQFRWPAQKKRHMDMYCDHDWKACPYAQQLTELYEHAEKEEDQMSKKILTLTHERDEAIKERRKLSSMLGKAKKREAEKDRKIRDLLNRNRALSDLYLRYRDEAKELREKERGIYEDMTFMAQRYEARFAYLIGFAGGKINEKEFEAWAKTHEYRVLPEYEYNSESDKNELTAYTAVVREISDDTDRGPATEIPETGGGKNKRPKE